jgi:EAL domain-containing protein (putative c-di-GMP-specific phosphodiesterase class I)
MTLLRQILDEGGIHVFVQPIFAIGGPGASLYAVEALSRGPKGSNAESAEVLFEYVRRKGREIEVDRACVRAILSALYRTARQTSVTMNVHASTVEHDDFFTAFLLELCDFYAVPARNLVLEIVEQQKYCDRQRFFNNLDLLRHAGVRIALDDIGLGYSNFRTMIEIRPDYYKVDRYFVTGCKDDDAARAAIESIVLLAARLGGRVIAEGVESQEDLETAKALGVGLVQGYHLAEPRPAETFETAALSVEESYR